MDWFHAEEQLEKVTQEALSPESAQEWLERVRTFLWEGDTSFVMRACQKLAAYSQEAAQAATYFKNNAQRMAYDLYRRPGHMNGSSVVESGCKQIFTQRLKRSGAQWLVAGANQTAKARVVWFSGNWEQLCVRRDLLPLADFLCVHTHNNIIIWPFVDL